MLIGTYQIIAIDFPSKAYGGYNTTLLIEQRVRRLERGVDRVKTLSINIYAVKSKSILYYIYIYYLLLSIYDNTMI